MPRGLVARGHKHGQTALRTGQDKKEQVSVVPSSTCSFIHSFSSTSCYSPCTRRHVLLSSSCHLHARHQKRTSRRSRRGQWLLLQCAPRCSCSRRPLHPETRHALCQPWRTQNLHLSCRHPRYSHHCRVLDGRVHVRETQEPKGHSSVQGD